MCSPDNSKQYAVNWNNHMNHIKKSIDTLLFNNELTDVTLYAEGKSIKAHKMLLSACSQYFQRIFREVPQQHPIIVLNGVKFNVLTDLLKFIYCGEVSVNCDVINSFLQTAQLLQISGLTENSQNCQSEENNEDSSMEIVEQITHKRSLESNCVKKDVKKHKPNKKEFLSFECNQLDAESNETVVFETPKEEIKSESVTEQQLYECDICGKTYRLKDSLYKHLSVHAGNTTCTVCSKVLSRKTHLERHMLMKHGIALKSTNGG